MKKLGLALSMCMMMFVQVGCGNPDVEPEGESKGGPPAGVAEAMKEREAMQQQSAGGGATEGTTEGGSTEGGATTEGGTETPAGG